jgi:hypothetical protein
MQGLLEKAVVKVLSRYMALSEATMKLISDEIASEYYSAEAEASLGEQDADNA